MDDYRISAKLVDSIVDLVKNIYFDSANKLGMSRTINENRNKSSFRPSKECKEKPWFNDECQTLRREFFRLWKKKKKCMEQVTRI